MRTGIAKVLVISVLCSPAGLSACGAAQTDGEIELEDLSELQTALLLDPEDDTAFRRIASLLTDPEAESILRCNAVFALGTVAKKHSDFRSGSMIPLLTNLLEDDQHCVRRGAAGALGEYGSVAEPAVPALVRRLSVDRDSDIAQSAASALGRIGQDPEVVVPALAALIPHGAWASGEELEAIRRFGERGSAATPKLIEALGNPNRRYAVKALRALANVDPRHPEFGRAALQLYRSALSLDDAGTLDRFLVLLSVDEATLDPIPPTIAELISMAVDDANPDVREIAARLKRAT
jgi:HEAT repeat protein